MPTHTVLLVDDDIEVLRCLARILQRQPYQLFTAHCAEEAMTILKCRRVDVIVADERMPGMSGTELLAWVANHYGDVVRILLTGFGSAETITRAVNEGGVFYVFTKPCNEAHLAVMIRKALDHKDDLASNAQILEQERRQAREREHLGQDLEALERLLVRDLKRPLDTLTASCLSLMEHHDDLFDHQARSLIEGSMEAISDMQALVEDLRARARAWPATGGERRASAATPPVATRPHREG